MKKILYIGRTLLLFVALVICFSFFFASILMISSPNFYLEVEFLLLSSRSFLNTITALVTIGSGLSGVVVLLRFLATTQKVSILISERIGLKRDKKGKKAFTDKLRNDAK